MEFRRKNKIIVILGPTSSGKSDVAIRIAKKFNGEIISADSRQIYRGMDIGTGKVPKSKCKNKNSKLQFKNNKLSVYCSSGILHYLIDIASPKNEYNVSEFKKDANYVINYVIQKDNLPIICGGTGFWIKSVVDDVDFPEVRPDKNLRKRIAKESLDKLFLMLKKIDPERAENIDAKNKVRLIRAIEICKAIGKVPTQETRNKRRETRKFLQIGIDIPKEDLHKNIKKRLEKRLRLGMIKEVKKLRKSGLSWKKIQSFGLGYYWIPLYLQNNISKDELFEKVYRAEKDYAKRQLTWFKKDKRIKWTKNFKEIEKITKKFLNK